MSSARRYRRHLEAVPRRPGVELAAATRSRIAELVRAIDDDQVDVDEMARRLDAWGEYLAGCDRSEQIEAGAALAEHCLQDLLRNPHARVAGFLVNRDGQ